MPNLDWAHSIARQVLRGLPTWFTIDDLIGPADIGLIQAAERYDAAEGVPFRAYAQRRVYGACISAIRRREYQERAHHSLEALAEVHGARMDRPDPAPSPEEQAQEAQRRGIWAHVWRLPAMHRAVIQRVYGEGHTLVEIAATADVGEGRLSRIHREALDMLRAVCEAGL